MLVDRQNEVIVRPDGTRLSNRMLYDSTIICLDNKSRVLFPTPNKKNVRKLLTEPGYQTERCRIRQSSGWITRLTSFLQVRTEKCSGISSGISESVGRHGPIGVSPWALVRTVVSILPSALPSSLLISADSTEGGLFSQHRKRLPQICLRKIYEDG